ncbi:MAG: hypothetical protein RMN53_16890 [Anaerolineae bacterium]|nr:hypothetical protein [Anaerolineae bacterium]
MRSWRTATLVAALMLAAACSGPAPTVRPDVGQAVQPAVATADSAGGSADAGRAGVVLEAANPAQAVAPGAEAVFDLKMVNASEQPLSVVVVLEHASGQRWRTSLCVEKQCLLGDGTEPSVSEPVALPPYVERAFKVQLFVDPAARAGQRTALAVRVEPQGDGLSPRGVTLRAQVAAP